MGELTTLVQYGISERATEENVGVPMLRMNNLQADGWDLTDLKYTQLVEEDLERYLLQPGDLLFNRTNSKELVGKCEVFHETGAWVFASYLIRVRLSGEVLPEFVSTFLNAPAGRAQIDRVSRHIVGMANVNAVELRDLLIPLPAPAEQRKLMELVETARVSQKRKLAEAEELLTSLDGWLMEQLPIKLPPVISRNVFAVPYAQIGLRFDPHFHGPHFKQITNAIEALPHARLGTLAELAPELWTPAGVDAETFRYIEISGVSPRTGEAVAVETPLAEAPSRARLRVRNGNIIVSLTRPHHGSIAMIDQSLDGCIASTGFAVLSHISENALPIYLWCILRSQLCLNQMLQRSSGGNYPAITESELKNILIPLPKPDVQKKIIAEIIRRRDAARSLRAEAVQEWAAAKACFESALLGRSAKEGRTA